MITALSEQFNYVIIFYQKKKFFFKISWKIVCVYSTKLPFFSYVILYFKWSRKHLYFLYKKNRENPSELITRVNNLGGS